MSTPAALAFSGGGALGIAHLGAWQVLAESFDIAAVAGTSAGAIAAAFCGMGFGPDHTIDCFWDIDLPTITGPSLTLSGLLGGRGKSDGRHFEHWLRTKLSSRFYDLAPEQLSFNQVLHRTDIELKIIATNYNDLSQPIIFDSTTEPDTLITFAVRASMSVPIYFSPVQRLDKAQVLVDGGLMLNFPLRPLLPLAQERSMPLIGIHFAHETTFLNDPRVWDLPATTLRALMSHSNSVPTEVSSYDDYIDVAIDVAGFNWLDFGLTRSKKEELLVRGRTAAKGALQVYENRVLRRQIAVSNQNTIPIKSSDTHVNNFNSKSSDNDSISYPENDNDPLPLGQQGIFPGQMDLASRTEAVQGQTTIQTPLSRGFTHSDKLRLRDMIIKHFTLNDLRMLCQNMNVDYESIEGGDNKLAKARELVSYCDRRMKLPQLLEACREFLPDVPW